MAISTVTLKRTLHATQPVRFSFHNGHLGRNRTTYRIMQDTAKTFVQNPQYLQVWYCLEQVWNVLATNNNK